MYFPALDTRLPIELLCIRMAAYVETEAEKQNLLAAWRQCLINGPSVQPLKIRPQPVKIYAKPSRQPELGEPCLVCV